MPAIAAAELVAMSVLMAALWLVQWRRRDASFVDAAWTLSLGALALAGALATPGDPGRRALVAALAGLWSLRLGIHLLADRVIGRPEDGRYVEMRRRWGRHQQAWFFGYFQLQALAAVLFSVPFLVAMRNPAPPFTPADGLALLVWATAVGGEWLADGQLARFRAERANRGRTCRAGLWGWSRHPNYFFEWMHWWTYPLLAIGANGAAVTLGAPTLMLLLLLGLTGIPANEARALVTRGEDYRDYQRRTSPFLPWPPKRSVR